jgi:glycosyltransferase involved in cell wall biosynthesis
MRIGIDARTLYGKDVKGIGVYLKCLLREIATLDEKNQYILYYDSRTYSKLLPAPGDNFVSKGIRIEMGDTFHFWEQFRLSSQVILDKPDLFHAPANTLCFTRCPTIVTIHDTILQDITHKRFVDRVYYRLIQPFIVRRAKLILSVSSFSKNCIVDRFKIHENRVKVVPSGVDQDFFQKVEDEVIEGKKKKFDIMKSYILSVGGESPWKNVGRLIESFSVLVKKHNVKEDLVIVGIRNKDVLEEHLNKVASLNLTGKVKILGYIPKDDLIGLFSGAKVFVYPSLWEGFGFPPLEAMACGVPVVASNAASIPEVVGDAAVLFNAKDIADLVNAIKRVIIDEGLRFALCAKGLEKAKEYSWEATAKMTLSAYNSVLKTKYSGRK